jgi:tetratricopeptide (TPR) repeat protein
LALQKAKLGPDHPDTLGGMNNLANSYAALGRHADALNLDEETLALMKAKLGPDHPRTLRSMNNLANSYADLGRVADARKVREQTLALQKAKLGPDHPDTLMSMHNLANSYAALGRYADARTLQETTLALRKARLGPNHPDTLISMWGLAESFLKLDRGAEAVPLIDECLKRAAGRVVHPRLMSDVVDLRLRHFEKTKDAAGCRSTAELWEQLTRTDGASLYDAACMRAVTAAVLRATDPSPKGAQEAGAEADRAMRWLTQAVAAGFKEAAHMKRDPDLDALRDRSDFKKLLADVEAGKEKDKH